MSEKQDAIKEVVGGFLEAMMKGENLQPFVQISGRQRARPEWPRYTAWEIERLVPVGGKTSVQVGAIIRLRFDAGGGMGLQWIRARVAVVCEDEQGQPDPKGEWGVVPASYRPLEEKE